MNHAGLNCEVCTFGQTKHEMESLCDGSPQTTCRYTLLHTIQEVEEKDFLVSRTKRLANARTPRSFQENTKALLALSTIIEQERLVDEEKERILSEKTPGKLYKLMTAMKGKKNPRNKAAILETSLDDGQVSGKKKGDIPSISPTGIDEFGRTEQGSVVIKMLTSPCPEKLKVVSFADLPQGHCSSLPDNIKYPRTTKSVNLDEPKLFSALEEEEKYEFGFSKKNSSECFSIPEMLEIVEDEADFFISPNSRTKSMPGKGTTPTSNKLVSNFRSHLCVDSKANPFSPSLTPTFSPRPSRKYR